MFIRRTEEEMLLKLTENVCIYFLNLLLSALWNSAVIIFCEKSTLLLRVN
jgi:hypothetical protein